ncbi:hypothetical protein [Streptomyces sp. NPDC004266]|uniref:hypothetical protein n=1 Tax=Streptomyces sp. NPDC004266 TaxID=3364693 RepID=UPI00369ED756
MPSSCDPQYAPAGDVSAAMLLIDSRLRAVYDGRTEVDPERRMLDVVEYVVPTLVTAMLRMSGSIRPEAVPTMAGLAVAAGTGLGPSLWRGQYGEWTREETNALEATAFLLAEVVNRITDDRDFATRPITDALSGADRYRPPGLTPGRP